MADHPDPASPMLPTGIDGVVGHEHVAERFRRTLRRGRLASTYLFLGPEGIGKRTMASALASALLCAAPGDDPLASCGVCRSCRFAAGGTHPDLIAVSRPEGRSTLPLELFLGPPEHRGRAGLCHDLALRPAVAARRVAIVDDADHLAVEGANCLLKTLEEPPPRSLLILVGTSLARQLPTIRSRSQVVRFGRLSDAQVALVLRSRLGISAGEAERLAPLGGGSVSGALAERDPARCGARDALAAELSAERIDAPALALRLEELAKQAGSEPSARRERLRELLGWALAGARQRLCDDAARGLAVEGRLAAVEACLDAEEALARNANQSALAARFAQRLARAW